jgi:cytochrome c-type biogenesis protein CcmH/NrfG
MDVLTLLFRLPLLPLKGVIRIGELVRDEVDQQMRDPALVRRQLEEASEARASGEISEEDAAKVEAEAVARLVPPARPAPESGARDGEGS